jgi:hypothetical protein
MNILCQIVVTSMIGSIPFINTVAAEGVILKKTDYNYLVDFTETAKINDYVGDYAKVLVKHEDCVEL